MADYRVVTDALIKNANFMADFARHWQTAADVFHDTNAFADDMMFGGLGFDENLPGNCHTAAQEVATKLQKGVDALTETAHELGRIAKIYAGKDEEFAKKLGYDMFKYNG